MRTKKEMNIAVVDTCEFTLIGLEQLVNREPVESMDIHFHGFTEITDLCGGECDYDVVIYDPLNTRDFMVNVEQDVQTIKLRYPRSRVYIYSASVGFLKVSSVDGMFSKSISLGDLEVLWRIIISRISGAGASYHLNIAVDVGKSARLTSEEASVLRGYAWNLKTKQIARLLGCNVRQVYFYKSNAMNKLNVMRGPAFHQQIRCILN
ncbi:DNA-binding response regulator [Erwinia sp. CPCC 100877]|nr:DNA-binding response regulator [Erwinia sp. CPCC 100877]